MPDDHQTAVIALGSLFTLSGVAVIFWRSFAAIRGEIDRAIKPLADVTAKLEERLRTLEGRMAHHQGEHDARSKP